MTIRRAQHEDLPAVKLLVDELEETVLNEVDFERVFKKNLLLETHHYFLVWDENTPLALLSMVFSDHLHHAKTICEIQELVVTASYRNQKIGEKLIEFAKNYCKKKEVDQIELSSNFKRTRAHEFYMRQGFTRGHYKFVWKLPSGTS